MLSKGEVRVLHLREFELGGKAGALPPRETPSEADAEVAASVEILTKVIHLADRPVLIVL